MTNQQQSDGPGFLQNYQTHKELLNAAHELGVVSIITEIIAMPSEQNGHTAYFKATVTLTNDRVFTGFAWANRENAKRVAGAFFMMAETRAINRALRLATNRGDTSAEEMPDADHEAGEINTSKARNGDTRTPVVNVENRPLESGEARRVGDRILPEDDPYWTDPQTGILKRADTAMALGVDMRALLRDMGINKWQGKLTLTQCDELKGRLGLEIAKREPALT